MRHLARVSLQFLITLALTGSLFSAAKKEFFTEAELDLIRDAQELRFRVPAYFKLAERRLIFLGLMEKSEKEKEKERKEKEKFEKEQKKASDKGITAPKPPIDEMKYLSDFSRSELLRGYIQALDEVMSNIDDAYERKLEVRDQLEELEKFTRETIPVLEKFQPKSDNERAAMNDSIERAKEALNGAKESLNLVPKTEKKKKR